MTKRTCYSGIESGRTTQPTLNQLRHLAISNALLRRVDYAHLERVERDLNRQRHHGLPPHVKHRAYELRARGMSYGQIASALAVEKWQLRFLYPPKGEGQ